jgi:glycosyltransferase involved in cell wall biosynthesis
VYYLAKALRNTGGFEQGIFTIGPQARLFKQDDISVRVMRNESSLSGAMDAFSATLWQELRGFDLVHIHQSLTLFGAYTTAIVRSLGIPAIGTDLGGGENALMLQRRGMELLDGIVSISHYADSLIAGFFNGPREVLIGPVDTDRFSPALGAPRGGRRTVLCVSRIMPHKGIDRVIAALPQGLGLVVVGRVYHEPYHEMLCRMADDKDVRFVHDADDETLLDLFRSAGLFVQASTVRDVYGNVASKPELMGLTTLEAMACGLPAVVSDTGSLPELVPDSRFGHVFSGEEELSAILRAFSLGLWPVPEAATLARAHVLREHGTAAIGGRLAAFYTTVAARGGV